MREGLKSAAVALSLFTGILLGCSGADDTSPNESATTGGGGSVGGTATGGAANAGGRTGAGGVGTTGGAQATGGGGSTGGIAQACASACNVLAQTNLTCAPDPCASGCEQGYNNAAAMPTCQAAYLSLLQCGAQQPASNWTCYYNLIAAPTTGCSAQMDALGTEGIACFIMLAAM
jgi:hypothetical protein